MNRLYWLVIIIFFGFCIPAKSQKPEIPPKDSIYLTLDLDTGNPTIFWAAPPLFPPVVHPDPTGYIIYKTTYDIVSPPPLGRSEAIDTVGPGVRSYTDLNANGNIGQQTYLIATNGPTEPSTMSSKHASIFITSFYDSCNHKIDLNWTNYQGWGNRIKKYDVYIGNTNNWATFPLYTSLPGTTNRASIMNVAENQDYYAYVKATKDTTDIGGTPFVTTSNLFYKKTTMPLHPATITIDSIIAADQRTNIYFKIDPSTELTNFQIVRWENSDSVKSIFSRKILHKFSDPSKAFYSDTADSWAARTRPFYYKIDALNSCPRIVKVSNHANSITPAALAKKGMKNKISWDELYIDTAINERKNNYARYQVIRYAYKAAPEPPVYLPETDKLEFIDDVHEFEGEDYSIKFCYQIEAFERNLLGQVDMFSRSRTQCVEIIPGVTMPDAIIPTDNLSNYGNSRNLFVPIITFRADYTLSIYNRWGNLIFYGENKGWNGYINGQLAKEGTYIYRLVVHTLGNRDVIKEGSFVVIYK